MISAVKLRAIARDRGFDAGVMEKDYVLGWVLYGISSSTVGHKLAFKGGTALSKIYYPGRWRLSEDLDFSLLEDVDWSVITNALRNEVPDIVRGSSYLESRLAPRIHTNPTYLQARIKYIGPIGQGTIKIDITREDLVGKTMEKAILPAFDYPRFIVNVYSIETIAAEKLLAIIQRGFVRDYYDAWMIFKTTGCNSRKARNIFLTKCVTKGVKYDKVSQFFPPHIEENLSPYMQNGLGRLLPGEPPTIMAIMSELRELLGTIFADDNWRA